MSLPTDLSKSPAYALAARRAAVSRQLDLMIEERGPVDLVRRLIADLDSISADLAKSLRDGKARDDRAGT